MCCSFGCTSRLVFMGLILFAAATFWSMVKSPPVSASEAKKLDAQDDQVMNAEEKEMMKTLKQAGKELLGETEKLGTAGIGETARWLGQAIKGNSQLNYQADGVQPAVLIQTAPVAAASSSSFFMACAGASVLLFAIHLTKVNNAVELEESLLEKGLAA